MFVRRCLLRICTEFQTIFDRASKTPESSEQLVEMIDFIDSARNVELVQLTESVKVRLKFTLLT